MTSLFSTAPFAPATAGSPHTVTSVAVTRSTTADEHSNAKMSCALLHGDDIAQAARRATPACPALDAYSIAMTDADVAAALCHRRGGSSAAGSGCNELPCCCSYCGSRGEIGSNNDMTVSHAHPASLSPPSAHLSAACAQTQQQQQQRQGWPLVQPVTCFAAITTTTTSERHAMPTVTAAAERMAMNEDRYTTCAQAAMSNVYDSSNGVTRQAASHGAAATKTTSADAAAFMSHALRDTSEASEAGSCCPMSLPPPMPSPMQGRAGYGAVPSNSTAYSSCLHPYHQHYNCYSDPMYEPDAKERLGRLHIAFKSLSKAERQRRVEAEAAATDLLARTVHLRFLPPCMFQHELAALCGACGEYLRIRICGNGQRTQNWIYGFVEFATRDGAVRMMGQSGRELYNGPLRPPLRLRCSAAKHPIVDRVFHDADPATKTLCIFGLGSYANRTLRDALESYTHLKQKEALLQRSQQQQQQQQQCVDQPCLSVAALSTSASNTRPSSTLNDEDEDNDGEEGEEAGPCASAKAAALTPSYHADRRHDTCAPSPVCSLAASSRCHMSPRDYVALSAAGATAAATPRVRVVTSQPPYTQSSTTATTAICTAAEIQRQRLVHHVPVCTDATTTSVTSTTLLPGARNTAQLLQHVMSQEAAGAAAASATTATRTTTAMTMTCGEGDDQPGMWRHWDVRVSAEASAPGGVACRTHDSRTMCAAAAAAVGSVGDKENVTSGSDVAACERSSAYTHTPSRRLAAGPAPVCDGTCRTTTTTAAAAAATGTTRQAASRELSAQAAPFVPMSDLVASAHMTATPLTLQPLPQQQQQQQQPYAHGMSHMVQDTRAADDDAIAAADNVIGGARNVLVTRAARTLTTLHGTAQRDMPRSQNASSQVPRPPHAMASLTTAAADKSSTSSSSVVSEMGCQLSCMLEHVMRSRSCRDGDEVLERARLLMLHALRHCVSATSSQLDFCNTVGTLHSLLELLHEQAALTGGPAQTSVADCARSMPQRTTQLQLLANLLLALLWLARRHLGKALPYVYAVVTCCNDIPLRPVRVAQAVSAHTTSSLSSCCCCCGSCPSSCDAIVADHTIEHDAACATRCSAAAKAMSDTGMPCTETMTAPHAAAAATRASLAPDAVPPCLGGDAQHAHATTAAAVRDAQDDIAFAAAEDNDDDATQPDWHRCVTSDELLHAVLDTLSSSGSDEDDNNESKEDGQRHNVTALRFSPACDACLGAERVTQPPMTVAEQQHEEEEEEEEGTHDVAFHCHVLHVLLCVGLAMELVEPAVARRTYALAAHRARAVLGMSCTVLDAWLTARTTASAQPSSPSSAMCTAAVAAADCCSNGGSLLARMWQTTADKNGDNVCEAAVADITTFPRLFFRSVASQLPRLTGSQAVFWHELPPYACMRCFHCEQAATTTA